METLVRLWVDGGVFQYPLLMLFLLATLMLLAQLGFARKMVFPRAFVGWSTSILALAVVGMAIGYRLAIDVLGQQELNRGLVCKANEVAHIPVLFALGMVAFLLVIKLIAEALGHRDVVGAFAPTRPTRLVAGFGVLALLVSSAVSLRAVMILNRASAEGTAARGAFDAVDFWLASGVTVGLAAVALGLLTVTLAIVSSLRRLERSAPGA